MSQALNNTSLKKLLEHTTKSKAIYERAMKVYPSGTTRSPYYFSPQPLYMERGEGCFVWDADGNRYLDFTNNMGPMILGHRNSEVLREVVRQLDTFWCGGPTELDVKLAETLLTAFPMTDKLLFTPSGTEAAMRIVRAARACSNKKTVLLSTGSYHGASDSLMPGPGVPGEETKLIDRFQYNNAEAFSSALQRTKADLCAVVLEGVLGAAGSVPPTDSFLKTVREETSRYGVPLIVDEVVTGFRVRRGGISELYGVKPDAVILGKIIGGGFPIGALLGTEELMSQFEYPRTEFPLVGKPNIMHAGTFNAHPVTMAAGLATLDQLDSTAYEHLGKLGGEVRGYLSKLCTEMGVPHSVTGIESIFQLHFSGSEIIDYESAKRCSDEIKSRIFDALMLARGVFLPFFHSAFCSLPMGKSELKQFKEAAAGALEETIALTTK